MPTLSSSSPQSPGNSTTLSRVWSFLSAPIAANASFLAASLHWLARAFEWFMNLMVMVLAALAVFGIGCLIYPIRREDESKDSGDEDSNVGLDAAVLTELELRAVGYDEEDDGSLESGDEI